MTLYKDQIENLVGNGFRLRGNGANPGNFVDIGGDGTVKLCKKAIGSVTTVATDFTFIIYANRNPDGSFAKGFTIDAYVNGELVISGVEYNIDYTADGVTMIHWYFEVSAAGALHVKNFACYDGVVIPTKE